jgi:hypothetical protein
VIRSSSQVTPSYGASYKRIMQIEAAYHVSLKLWITCNEDSSGPPYFKIHIAGGGEIFDHLPAHLGSASARVITAFDDPFGSALWNVLDQLESALERHAGYLIARPTP